MSGDSCKQQNLDQVQLHGAPYGVPFFNPGRRPLEQNTPFFSHHQRPKPCTLSFNPDVKLNFIYIHPHSPMQRVFWCAFQGKARIVRCLPCRSCFPSPSEPRRRKQQQRRRHPPPAAAVVVVVVVVVWLASLRRSLLPGCGRRSCDRWRRRGPRQSLGVSSDR